MHLHVILDDQLHARLKSFYPERGEVSCLVRTALELVVCILEDGKIVNTEKVAGALVFDSIKRGRGRRDTRGKTKRGARKKC